MRTHKIRPDFLMPQHLSKAFPRFIPIPHPQPIDCTLPLSAILDNTDAIQASGSISFHAVGDTGGINGTATQEAIAETMESQFPGPSFLYHLGDVIYYNGVSSDYEAQFYEPYKYYPAPIVAIPGNHDGDTHTYPGDPIDREPSLYGFFTNLCAQNSTPISTYRDSMTQPYCYWTLLCPFVTLIGLYGNVDGTLDGHGRLTQQRWLENQLASADPRKAIILAVHQPPYSLDRSHSGYPSIAAAINNAAQHTGIYPHAVLSGHVHNYQRFTRTLPSGRVIPYIVAGAGGYANSEHSLHKMLRYTPSTPVPCPSSTNNPEVELRGYNEKAAGFLTIRVDASTIAVSYYTVPFDGTPAPTQPFDNFILNYTTGTITSEMSPGTSGAI